MSDRKLLLIAVLLAAASIRCAGSPSEPEGSVIITQTTSTTTTTAVPTLIAGAIGTSPAGTGLAAATVFTFSLATPPSGGVPPYTFAWNFGDGAEGAGSTPSHVYLTTGTLTARVTVTDSRGITAQASAPVVVRNVNGRWTATLGRGLAAEPIDLVQNGAAVAATINSGAFGFGSGSGNVSNPRMLSVSAAFMAGTPTAFGVSYNGRLDETLTIWTGTATGYPGCPCDFTATRAPFAGDILVTRAPSP
jgi:hypothetical protein